MSEHDEPRDDEFDLENADLQAALGDLLADGADDDAVQPAPSGDQADLGHDALDLSMLEDAVAELGIDLDDADAATGRPEAGSDEQLSGTAGRNLGLDLTELPPPPGPPADPARPAKKLPPLGEASAADLFGDDETWDDLGDDFGDLGGADDGPSAPVEPTPLPEPAAPAAEADADGDGEDDRAEPDAPRADPTSDEVVAFAAHKGRLTGEIVAKGRKLFGR